jgi:GNAT superfamily N-acetyltransferase
VVVGVTPGLRTHKRASLRIAEPTSVPDDMRANLREIVSLQSDDHGKGHAKALLHQVCAEADRANVVLMLHVKPFADGMTLEQLEKFYEGHGFARIQDEPLLMARAVQTLHVARVA